MDKNKFKSVGDLATQELLGCTPDTDSLGNFEVLHDRLELMIALFRTRAIAAKIAAQIHREAKKLPVKFHEYVINELQYEHRLASYFESTNPGYEDRLLGIYGRWLEKRFPAAMIAGILEKTKINRSIRKRTAPKEKQ